MHKLSFVISLIIAIAILATTIVAASTDPVETLDLNADALNQEMIDAVNSHPESTWTAHRNRFFERKKIYHVQ
jgi:Peptidase family C1 propeptide